MVKSSILLEKRFWKKYSNPSLKDKREKHMVPLGMLIVNQVTFLETQYVFAKWKQNISYGFTIRI